VTKSKAINLVASDQSSWDNLSSSGDGLWTGEQRIFIQQSQPDRLLSYHAEQLDGKSRQRSPRDFNICPFPCRLNWPNQFLPRSVLAEEALCLFDEAISVTAAQKVL